MRSAPLLFSFASFAAFACSSGTTAITGDGGSSGSSGSSGEAGRATPQIILTAKLAAGAGSAARCPDAGKSLAIGVFSPPGPVRDGETFGGGVVTVSCRVHENPARAFDTAATARSAGASGGSFTYSGTADATGAVTAATILLTFEGQSYASRSCLLNPTAQVGGIAAGRYWADFTCAGAENAAADRSCDITGTLRVENCAQD